MNKKLMFASLIGFIALLPGISVGAEEICEEIAIPDGSITKEYNFDAVPVTDGDGSATTEYEVYEYYGFQAINDSYDVQISGDIDNASLIRTDEEALTQYGIEGDYAGLTMYEATIDTDFTIMSNGEAVPMDSTFAIYVPFEGSIDFTTGVVTSDFSGGSIYVQDVEGGVATGTIYEVDGSSYSQTVYNEGDEATEYAETYFTLPIMVQGLEGVVEFTKKSGDIETYDATFTFCEDIIEEPIDNDGDGLTDDIEIKLGTNPLLADSDGDGLIDGDEVNLYGTNPTEGDSDGDGISDGEEVEMGFDPLDETDFPVTDDTDDEDDEDDKLAYTGGGAPVGLLAAIGSALFIFKRK